MKNTFAKKLQRQRERDIHKTGERMAQWSMQAALDAAILTLGYGDCMGKDQWGRERIVRFAKEFIAQYWEVFGGISDEPDADAIRAKVDRLLAEKVPEADFAPWEGRYTGWRETTLEQEVREHRGRWKRQGMDTRDGGTGMGIRGASQNVHDL